MPYLAIYYNLYPHLAIYYSDVVAS